MRKYVVIALIVWNVASAINLAEREDIQELIFDYNKINGRLNIDFKDYENLESLSFVSNDITSIDPTILRHNDKLESLNLSGNTRLRLPTNNAPFLYTGAKHVNLSGCHLNDIPDKSLDGLTGVKVLDLTGNQIKFKNAVGLAHMKHHPHRLLVSSIGRKGLEFICANAPHMKVVEIDNDIVHPCSEVNQEFDKVFEDAKDNDLVSIFSEDELIMPVKLDTKFDNNGFDTRENEIMLGDEAEGSGDESEDESGNANEEKIEAKIETGSEEKLNETVESKEEKVEPEVKEDTSEVKEDTSEVKDDKPEVNIDETEVVKDETEVVKDESEVVKDETEVVKDETEVKEEETNEEDIKPVFDTETDIKGEEEIPVTTPQADVEIIDSSNVKLDTLMKETPPNSDDNTLTLDTNKGRAIIDTENQETVKSDVTDEAAVKSEDEAAKASGSNTAFWIMMVILIAGCVFVAVKYFKKRSQKQGQYDVENPDEGTELKNVNVNVNDDRNGNEENNVRSAVGVDEEKEPLNKENAVKEEN